MSNQDSLTVELRTFSSNEEGIYEMPNATGFYVRTSDYKKLERELAQAKRDKDQWEHSTTVARRERAAAERLVKQIGDDTLVDDYRRACEAAASADHQLDKEKVIRADLLAELAQAKAQRYPHWTCKTHGDFDARVVVGCPDCTRELRTELAQAKERIASLENERDFHQRTSVRLGEINTKRALQLRELVDSWSLSKVLAQPSIESDALCTMLKEALCPMGRCAGGVTYLTGEEPRRCEWCERRTQLTKGPQATAQPPTESQAAQEYVRDPCICKSTLALIARPDCPIHGMTASPQSEPGEAPYAWTIPGDDNADMNGFIPARIDSEGEFTKPLYARASQD